jgi:hypothetical protein
MFHSSFLARRAYHVVIAAVIASSLMPTSAAMAQARHALPFAIGERAEYNLRFGAVRVGSGFLSVAGPDSARGREVVRLVFRITGGIPLFRVNDTMESWFDPIRLESVRFTQELNEGPKHYSRRFDFFPEESVMLERGKPRAPTVASPLDDASFLFFIRTQPLENGRSYEYNRYFKPASNPVVLRVLRRERITVPAGTFDAVVVQPIIKTSGVFGDDGRAEVWLSDDARRIVLQMKSNLSFGSINLFLRAYTPGTGAPSR